MISLRRILTILRITKKVLDRLGPLIPQIPGKGGRIITDVDRVVDKICETVRCEAEAKEPPRPE